MLSVIKGDINTYFYSIYIMVECALPHTHCTLAAGTSVHDLDVILRVSQTEGHR